LYVKTGISLKTTSPALKDLVVTRMLPNPSENIISVPSGITRGFNASGSWSASRLIAGINPGVERIDNDIPVTEKLFIDECV
jgi:hypothetical protein